MSIERVSFSAKLVAPPPHETQTLHDDAEDAYERSIREPVRREAPEERWKWAFAEWPFPFASFWTSMAGMGLAYPAHHLLATLALGAAGVWAGVRLDKWLRAHPLAGGERVRRLLGVD